MSRGVTLIELLVVLVLLGLLFTVTGLALATLAPPRQSKWLRTLDSARTQAIRTATPVTVLGDSVGHVLFLPDGRALGPGVDQLTGAPVATR